MVFPLYRKEGDWRFYYVGSSGIYTGGSNTRRDGSE